jgi:hypothetical protein
MRHPTDHDNEGEAARIDLDRPYRHSVKLGDPGAATADNPNPAPAFINPDENSTMLGPAWEDRTHCRRRS